MDYILSDFLSDTITSLENLRKNDVRKEFSCIFKCAELEDYLNHNITESIQKLFIFSILFPKLNLLSINLLTVLYAF